MHINLTILTAEDRLPINIANCKRLLIFPRNNELFDHVWIIHSYCSVLTRLKDWAVAIDVVLNIKLIDDLNSSRDGQPGHSFLEGGGHFRQFYGVCFLQTFLLSWQLWNALGIDAFKVITLSVANHTVQVCPPFLLWVNFWTFGEDHATLLARLQKWWCVKICFFHGPPCAGRLDLAEKSTLILDFQITQNWTCHVCALNRRYSQTQTTIRTENIKRLQQLQLHKHKPNYWHVMLWWRR